MSSDEKESFGLLNQDAVINLFISGEIFPYMTGNNIISLGVKFGVDRNELDFSSRTNTMRSILTWLHNNGKTQRFLNYYVFSKNIHDSVRDVVQSNIDRKPIYEDVSNICEKTNETLSVLTDFIRKKFLSEINRELFFSDKKLVALNKSIDIIDIDKEVGVVESSIATIDDDYISNLLDNAKSSLQMGDFDSVVTKSRTLIESEFIIILHGHDCSFKENGNLAQYRGLVHKVLNMKPDSHWNKEVLELISGLNRIIDSIFDMRNKNSDAHGSSVRVSINAGEAELVLNAAVALVYYYKSINNRHQ